MVPNQSQHASSTAPPGQNASARGTVLIVDDNPAIRTLLSARVKSEGFAGLTADNGRKALSILRQQNVDVVLADISMPEMDGIRLLEAITGDTDLAHIPVLMISSGDDQGQIIQCIEKGAIDYLIKPFNQGILKARLTTCIARKQQRDRELHTLSMARAAVPVVIPGSHVVDALDDETEESQRTHVLPEPEVFVHDIARSDHGPRLTLPDASDIVKPNAVEILDHVGNIKLIRFIGKGAMGEVYLGHHELLNMDMAVKLVRGEWLANSDARRRFLQEARVAARLSHPNIVRLHEIGQSALGVYLAFEYVSGGTLKNKINASEGQRLSLNEAIAIAHGICLGLNEAHRLQIVHRDLKPANILLTPDGTPKVADMGLAKQISGDHASDLTGTYIPIGTPAYMAPEQIQSDSAIDTRVDLYSLGVILYQMLAGTVPFPEKQARDAMLAQLHKTPPPIENFNPDVPPWLRTLISALLEKSPADRPASALDVAWTLENRKAPKHAKKPESGAFKPKA
jgi:DNA-binding response OmpR family regulator/tRNA A-37 threonylcarbamoyl transferase component Bud32